MKRPTWSAALFVVVVLVMGFQATRLLRAQPPTMPRPADVINAKRTTPTPNKLDERELPPPNAVVSGTGVVEPAQPETRLGAAAAGVIARIAVVEGQHVNPGDVVVELDAELERAVLAGATAEVLAARAELDRAVSGSRADDIRAAIADSDNARARAELAQTVFARIEKAGDAITGDERDRARKQVEADEAAARAAAARAQSVIKGSRREDVRLVQARLAAAQARRDQAAAALARMTIRAPIAGEILRVSYRVGEYFQPAAGGGANVEPLMIVADTKQLRVRVEIDERDIGKLAVGAKVIVRANAFPGVDFSASIVEIGRRMGRKALRSDEPGERSDTKILEVVVALTTSSQLIVGQRVTAYVQAP